MTEAKGFKHIKVTPAEEPEVVIHAGAPQPVQPKEPFPKEEPLSQEEPVQASRPSRPQRAATQPEQSTTLEDIKGSKMPKTQLVVIILAVLAIIAFAVWYAFFS